MVTVVIRAVFLRVIFLLAVVEDTAFISRLGDITGTS